MKRLWIDETSLGLFTKHVLTVRINSLTDRINFAVSQDNCERSPPDPLSAIAPLLQVRCVEIEELCIFAAPWISAHKVRASGWAQFHIVVKGSCTIELADGQRLSLKAGSLLLLPHGDAHSVRSAPSVKADTVRIRSEHSGVVHIKTNTFGKSDTELICGRLQFDGASSGLIVSALPAAIVVDVRAMGRLGNMRSLVQMINKELRSDSLGALAITSNLSTALFVVMLRTHLEQAVSTIGLLKLLGTPVGARAVNAMTSAPGHAWTLDELALKANASRATLVRAFQKAAGMAPLAFLAEIRLSLARRSLVTTKTPVTDIAAAAGYGSDGAFIRAFTRRFGVSPGKVRTG